MSITYGFSDEQFNAVQLFAEVLSKPRELNVVEKKILSDLLINCIHGQDFNNAAVLAAIKGEKETSPIHRASLIMLKLHHYARHDGEFTDNHIAKTSGRPLDDKLSVHDGLSELGLLRDMSFLSDVVADLEKLRIVDERTKLDILTHGKKSHEVIDTIQQKFGAEGGAGLFNQLRRVETPRGQLYRYFAMLANMFIDKNIPEQKLDKRPR